MNNWYQILYVGGQVSLDTNNGRSPLKPKKIIQLAIDDTNANSGIQLIIFPWVYNDYMFKTKYNYFKFRI